MGDPKRPDPQHWYVQSLHKIVTNALQFLNCCEFDPEEDISYSVTPVKSLKKLESELLGGHWIPVLVDIS